MSIIELLPEIIKDSKESYERILEEDSLIAFELTEIAGKKQLELSGKNKLFHGDNLDLAIHLIKNEEMAEKINLIYVDPPFQTGLNYSTAIKIDTGVPGLIPTIKQKAYKDKYKEGLEGYLRMLTLRLLAMKDLLAEDGSIFIHLDWHAVHYVKIIMDEIFGERNFVNEIIWHYKSGGATTRRFARKHDTILFYSKSSKYYFKPKKEKSYNRGYKPYKFKGVKEFRDEKGWYTMVNRKDVWELDMVGRTSAERTGYVTQKPESLIERILESCTKEGDLCADFFGGSGTMAAAASKMNRRWISCDIGKPAIISTIKRMVNQEIGFEFYEIKADNAETKDIEVGVDVSIDKHPLLDKYLVNVELKDYQALNYKKIPIGQKHIPLFEKGIQKDSLQFIAYWNVDLSYNGSIPKPDEYITRKDWGLEIKYEGIIDQVGPIYVSGMDIFGNKFKFIWKES